MRIRKMLCLLLCVLMVSSLLVACQSGEKPCQHEYEQTETAGIFADKQRVHTCKICGDSYSETIGKASKSLKILAIGNSFNNNSSSLLYDIATNAGARNVIIGCLWIGGSSIADHAANIASGEGKYEYRKNRSGSWKVTQGYTFLQGLQDEDWDFIVINQQSILAGQPGMVDADFHAACGYIAQNKPAGAKLYFSMTWGYDADYTANVNFGKYYGFDTQKMYESIRTTVVDYVMPTGYFDGYTPCGTVVQNLRTSWAKDLLTADGYHASTHVGCYALGLTWLATFTDIDVASIEYFPRMGTKWGVAYEQALLEIIKEAVLATQKNPLEVTQSSFAEKPKFDTIH
ncbi:MAG: DUF4886 domain-containing protein [Oscillospiraceae bacterium]|nr:DUF4886 domain-containing protein [Oscillospiraceae bacterium]